MPASAYSSSFAWGVYLVASLLLVAALYPSLDGIAGYAEAYAAESIAAGVCSDLTALRPGMSFTFGFSSLPPSTSISLGPDFVQVKVGSSSTKIPVSLLLPNITLLPGNAYTFALAGTAVEVTPHV